jgi:hypothetical protein
MRCERVGGINVPRCIFTCKFYGLLRNPSEPQRTRLLHDVCHRGLAFVIVFVWVLFVPWLAPPSVDFVCEV